MTRTLRGRRTAILALTFVLSIPACQSPSDRLRFTDELVNFQRKPPSDLSMQDYEILTLVLEDICDQFRTNRVLVEQETLSGEQLQTANDEFAREVVADVFHVDIRNFCRLAQAMTIDVRQVTSNRLEIERYNSDAVLLSGVTTALTAPVFSASGRAFVYIVAYNNDGSAGYSFYCLKRDGETWHIEEAVVLALT